MARKVGFGCFCVGLILRGFQCAGITTAKNLTKLESGRMKTQVKALVVGGGAVGTSIAYHLAKAGWEDRDASLSIQSR